MKANFRTILAFVSLGIILWVSFVGLMVEFGSGMAALTLGQFIFSRFLTVTAGISSARVAGTSRFDQCDCYSDRYPAGNRLHGWVFISCTAAANA